MGQILALLASLCAAVSSKLYNRMGSFADSDLLAYLRMLIALPMMIIYALLANGFVFVTLHDFLFLVLSGFIGFFITDVFLFRSYIIMGARETMVVMCLSPVFSTIISYFFFGEILSNVQIIGISFIVIGIILLVTSDGFNHRKILSFGLICALLAAVFQSLADTTAKACLTNNPWVTSGAIRAIGGTLGWIVYGAVRGKRFFRNISYFKNPKTVLLLSFTLFMGTVLGTTFAMGALKMAKAGIVTCLKQTSPIFILLYELVFEHRKTKVLSIVGTAVSVAGVAFLF